MLRNLDNKTLVIILNAKHITPKLNPDNFNICQEQLRSKIFTKINPLLF